MRNRKPIVLLAAAAAATLSLVTTAQAAAPNPSRRAAAVPAPATTAPGRAAGAVVEDITIQVPDQFNPVHAFLVRPAGPPIPRSHAGVLFLHWLGDLNSDRGEVLPEAIGLAGRGVVSLLIQFADRDVFVDADQRAAVTAAAPGATVTVYSGEHQLTDQAKADRDAFLAARLGIGG